MNPISADLSSDKWQWQGIEQSAKSSIHEKKIRVAFLPADGSAPAVNGVSHGEDSSFRDSPTPAPRTPMRGSESAAAEERPASSNKETARSAESAAAGTTIGAVAASVAKAVPTSSEELQAQLAEAKATITRLQAQAQEAVLRQRKTDSATKGATEKSTSGLSVQHAPAGGVSVPVAALLCLLCFLIAYFFF